MKNSNQLTNFSVFVSQYISQQCIHTAASLRLMFSLTFLLLSTSVYAQNFIDVTTNVGISSEEEPTFGNPIWADFDNDGTLDVFIVNHGQEPSLFQNNGSFLFTDIVSTSGILLNGGDRHGTAWGDFDNDGDKDLFITLGGGGIGGSKDVPDQLYRNDWNSTGNFTDIAVQAGVTNDFGRGRSINWVDFDNDGLLDIFLNNLKVDNLLLNNNGDGTFTDVATASGVVADTGTKSSWSDYDKDGDMDFFTTSDKDQLWQNNGDGTFSEVTSVANIADEQFGQSLAWGDFNNDGLNDLFIARGYNDAMGGLVDESKTIGFNATIKSSDAQLEAGLDFSVSGGEVTFDLYTNNCREVVATFLGKDSSVPATMPFTVSARDVRNKPVFVSGEDFGFFVWRDTSGWHIRWSNNTDGKSSEFYGKITTIGRFSNVVPINFTPRTREVTNTLYQNNGDGTFTDVSLAAGISGDSNNRGAVWGDYDNDGDLDLYVMNSGDFLGNGNNYLYKNQGDGTFRNVARAMGVQALADGRGEGMAWGDFNNDGLLDIYLTNGAQKPVISQAGIDSCLVHGPHVLFENTENRNQWLKITLVGTSSNRDAIGAKLNLSSVNTSQYREYNGGGGDYLSHGSSPIHFGLGADTIVDELIIQWPAGNIQVLNNISAGQHITIEEEINNSDLE